MAAVLARLSVLLCAASTAAAIPLADPIVHDRATDPRSFDVAVAPTEHDQDQVLPGRNLVAASGSAALNLLDRRQCEPDYGLCLDSGGCCRLLSMCCGDRCCRTGYVCRSGLCAVAREEVHTTTVTRTVTSTRVRYGTTTRTRVLTLDEHATTTNWVTKRQVRTVETSYSTTETVTATAVVTSTSLRVVDRRGVGDAATGPISEVPVSPSPTAPSSGEKSLRSLDVGPRLDNVHFPGKRQLTYTWTSYVTETTTSTYYYTTTAYSYATRTTTRTARATTTLFVGARFTRPGGTTTAQVTWTSTYTQYVVSTAPPEVHIPDSPSPTPSIEISPDLLPPGPPPGGGSAFGSSDHASTPSALDGLSTPAKVGIAFGTSLVSALAILMAACGCKKRREEKNRTEDSQEKPSGQPEASENSEAQKAGDVPKAENAQKVEDAQRVEDAQKAENAQNVGGVQTAGDVQTVGDAQKVEDAQDAEDARS